MQREDFYFTIIDALFPQERKLNTTECVISVKRLDNNPESNTV